MDTARFLCSGQFIIAQDYHIKCSDINKADRVIGCRSDTESEVKVDKF